VTSRTRYIPFFKIQISVFIFLIFTKVTSFVSSKVPIQDILPLQDDAQVAKYLRQQSLYQVTEDGRYILNTMDYSLLDQRTIYVQNIPKKSSVETLRQEFMKYGSITSIFYPESKYFKRHAFITFEEASSLELVIQTFPFTQLQDITSKNNTYSYFILSKLDWQKRSLEYQSLLELKRQQLQELKESRAGTHASLAFEAGVVAQFKNVHSETSSRVLKALFEMIAPVSFIDYSGGTSGHVRFKTRHGAHLACAFFTKEFIHQSHPDDTGSLLTLKQDRARKKSKMNEAKQELQNSLPTNQTETEFEQRGIEMYLLKGRDEEAYWNRIMDFQNRKKRKAIEKEREEEKSKKIHLVFDSDQE
jgi:RNA recognition motif-containing protein